MRAWPVVLLGVLLVGCQSAPAEDRIGSAAEFAETMAKARDLTVERLVAFESGIAMTEDDRMALEEAIPLTDRMIRFDPSALGPRALRGKIFVALERPQDARTAFENALKFGTVEKDQAAQALRAEIHLDLARLAMTRQDYSEVIRQAQAGTALFPDPRLKVVEARAHVQRREFEKARALLKAALEQDPQVPEAASILKFIEEASQP